LPKPFIIVMSFMLLLPWQVSASEPPGASWIDAFDLRRTTQAQPATAWRQLGPTGATVAAVAVSARWPAERTILAARVGERDAQSDFVRSRDGGLTWERFGYPADGEFITKDSRIDFFGYADTGSGADLAFLLTTNNRPGSPNSQLYRSANAGMSWEVVFAASGLRRLLLSPDFRRDRLAVLLGNGVLHRSSDGGVTWEPLSVPDDQVVETAVLSPTFAADHTMFAAVTHPDYAQWDASLGVLRSTDAGNSWLPLSAGLAIDGTPYPLVQSIAVSPSFHTDGTVVALASMVREPGGCAPSVRRCARASHIFRSTDRGATWQPAVQRDPPAYPAAVYGFRGQFSLSPDFPRDGVGLLQSAIPQGGPGALCVIYRTQDGGETWDAVLHPLGVTGSGSSCSPVTLVGTGPQAQALVFVRGSTAGWQHSTNAGLTWSELRYPPPSRGVPDLPGMPQPGANPQSPASDADLLNFLYGEWHTPTPDFGADPRYFFGTSRGVFTYGPEPCDDRAIGGRYSVRGGFAAIRQQQPQVREALGCPVEDERPTQLRMVTGLGGSSGLFVAGEPGYFWRAASGELDWVGRQWSEPDQAAAIDGAVQRFQRGYLLWLNPADGNRQILVLLASRWYEFPDPGP
jgi:hypothetical protein